MKGERGELRFPPMHIARDAEGVFRIVLAVQISPLQKQIMCMLRDGLKQLEIAKKLNKNPKTVHAIVSKLHDKIGTRTPEQLAIVAYQAFTQKR